MGNTANTSPGTVVNTTGGVGTIAWGSPSRALTSNNIYATASLTLNTTSNYLVATNYGFAIPAGATITGIVATIERGWATSNVRDNRVRIMLPDGSIGATDRASADLWLSADTVVTYGSSTDLWGETWTPAGINDADFGVALSVTNTAPADEDACTANVDHFTITIYYTEGMPQIMIF